MATVTVLTAARMLAIEAAVDDLVAGDTPIPVSALVNADDSPVDEATVAGLGIALKLTNAVVVEGTSHTWSPGETHLMTTNVAATTISVPHHDPSEANDIHEFEVIQLGTGQATITATGLASVIKPSDRTASTRLQYSRIKVAIVGEYSGDTLWLVSGDMTV